MPLQKGSSEKTIQANIREMRAAGHSEAQSVAAAEREAHDYSAKLDAALTAAVDLLKRAETFTSKGGGG